MCVFAPLLFARMCSGRPFNAICILIIRDVVLVKRQTRKAIKAIKPIKKYRKIFYECELFKVYTLWQLVAYISVVLVAGSREGAT